MPYSPFEGFQIGQKAGKAKRSTFGMTSDTLLDQFNKASESNREINKLMAVEKFKNSLSSPKEEAQADYYRASADLMRGGFGSSPSDVSSIASQAGIPEEDYFMNPTVNRYRGQMNVQNAPQLKQPLDAKSTEQVKSLRSIHMNMKNNLGLMTPQIKGFMNPLDPRASRGGIGSGLLKIQSMGDPNARDFITFKAETDKLFQEFRKDTTGAQAALKELGWLAPDFPEPNDPPDTYMNKANEAIRRIEQGEQLLLNTYSERGFRVGDLRKGSLNQNALVKSANRAYSSQDAGLGGEEDEEAIFKRLRELY